MIEIDRYCAHCAHCDREGATLRILHDGKVVEGPSCCCKECWSAYEDWCERHPNVAMECDLCRKDVDLDHLTAEPIEVSVTPSDRGVE